MKVEPLLKYHTTEEFDFVLAVNLRQQGNGSAFNPLHSGPSEDALQHQTTW